MESTRRILINNINEMRVGDNIIINRIPSSQKYFNSSYEEDIKTIDGIVSMVNYDGKEFVLNNNMIGFETTSSSFDTFIYKIVPVIIID